MQKTHRDKVAIFEPEIMPDYFEDIRHANCRYYASELFMDSNFSEDRKVKAAIDRAISACIALKITASHHFQPIFRSLGNSLYRDWKLSQFGCHLSLLNGDPSNPMVAEFQMYSRISGSYQREKP